MTGVVTSMHCNAFLEIRFTFELPVSFTLFLSSAVICVCLKSISRQNQTLGGEENILAAQVKGMSYSKTLRRQESVICSYLYTWRDIVLIFKSL